MAQTTVTRKAYEDLPPRKQAFIDAYLQHGDRNQAYLDAGYSPSKRTHKANAYQLYREVQWVIQAEVDKRIGTGAVKALSIIRDLMQNASSETVRLQAAKDYLTRAGYDKPVEQKVSIDDLREVKDGDLKGEIEMLLGKAITAPSESKGTH